MIIEVSVAISLFLVSAGQYGSEVAGAPAGVRFQLLEGSSIADLNVPGPAPAGAPLRGSFVLRELPVASPVSVYAVEHIRWQTPPGTLPAWQIFGDGTYAVLDPAASGQHSLSLQVAVNANTSSVELSSGWTVRSAPFPTIEITVTETVVANDHRYRLHLVAEPMRVFLFSTKVGFGSWQPDGLVPISDGDLLLSTGRRFRTHTELTQNLGIMPPVPNIGLDAVTLTPASASVLFSAETDIFSEWIGPLRHGDLINEHGFVFYTIQQLTSAFGPMPPAPDAGLDAVDFALTVGETWFSIEEPLFAERLGATLQPGDVLSDAGYVVRTNAQLLARFQIVQPDAGGYGLDALHVLPNGVLLFSTDTAFVDARFGWVSDGDLLSENGHIVRRNREVMTPFQPAEDSDNFGLDGLYVLHPVWVGDSNNSGTIDAADQAAFEACLTGPSHLSTAECNWADVNASDSVDLLDFADLQAHPRD